MQRNQKVIDMHEWHVEPSRKKKIILKTFPQSKNPDKKEFFILKINLKEREGKKKWERLGTFLCVFAFLLPFYCEYAASYENNCNPYKKK